MKMLYKRLLSIGIAVGVLCALFVFSLGQTQLMTMQLRNKILESGLHKIINSPTPSSRFGMGLAYARMIQSLLPDKIDSAVKAISYKAITSYEGEPLPVSSVLGTDSKLAVLTEMQVVKGRFLTTDDIAGYKKVCVLKSNVYDLVKTRDATHITINDDKYEIIGVVTGNEGSNGFSGSMDVMVPVTTLNKYIEKTDEQSGLILEIILDRGDFSKGQILSKVKGSTLPQEMDISGLKLVPEQDDSLGSTNEFLKTFALIFLLSLLVLIIAALNIIHIAAASIIDREREIGLRTALGAKPFHITFEITKEILACTIKGGIAGAATVAILNTVANLSTGIFGPSYNVITLLAGIFLAAATGFITSIIPAVKAAKLNPAAALREE